MGFRAPVPEMAAAAYDVAALALKGSAEAALNFPDMVSSYPTPASTSAADIRVAAARAAELKKPNPDLAEAEPDRPGSAATEFVDEEELLNMPTLLTDMAEGMLVSPPRMHAPSRHDSPEIHEGDSLWSYK
ncbi:PREDICTED: ethylene-responsive transcription factor ERF025-like [Tarenaya hassleriana]|uniref:ethylene-responsive transcription factor ERF025-like n=1 Tax=Tarenaya hassleriana TaxID=28532 RepID=UPI0008FD2A2E|nr:PREDICTED: ethylene-responsive transcription factor ERF025-like [Tarenaya hassleriana]